jgi:hypothetical protein
MTRQAASSHPPMMVDLCMSPQDGKESTVAPEIWR